MPEPVVINLVINLVSDYDESFTDTVSDNEKEILS